MGCDWPRIALDCTLHAGLRWKGNENEKKGVIKTKPAGRGWQTWLEVPGVEYPK